MKKEWEDYIESNLRYDQDSGNLWWAIRGQGRPLTRPAGSNNGAGYLVIKITLEGDKKRFFAHRIVWFLCHKEWPIAQIDHINGVKDDNRIANLRQATHSQNQFNKHSQGGSSIYKGVSFREERGIWRAVVQLNKKSKYLGAFKTQEEAALAYDKAAKALFGEFAKLNFPEED